MTAAICGHDRETLRSALEFANSSNLDAVSRKWPRPDNASGALLYDIHDPAKLAAIIAELLCTCGIVASTRMRKPGESLTIWVNSLPNSYHPNESQMVCIRPGNSCALEPCHDLSMPQARTFALTLLDSPQVTAKDIERMIGEL